MGDICIKNGGGEVGGGKKRRKEEGEGRLDKAVGRGAKGKVPQMSESPETVEEVEREEG